LGWVRPNSAQLRQSRPESRHNSDSQGQILALIGAILLDCPQVHWPRDQGVVLLQRVSLLVRAVWGVRVGNRVSGFRFRVSGFGFQVAGFDFRFRVSGFGFQVSGFGFQVPVFGFRGSGDGKPDNGQRQGRRAAGTAPRPAFGFRGFMTQSKVAAQ